MGFVAASYMYVGWVFGDTLGNHLVENGITVDKHLAGYGIWVGGTLAVFAASIPLAMWAVYYEEQIDERREVKPN